MQFLVYTCVFGGHDRVFPPVQLDPAVDYIAITDKPDLHIDGWRILHVDVSRFVDARSANRYFKMLGHRELPGYVASIYVDGNIRLLGLLSGLIQTFVETGAALGVFPHPLRSSVAEEVEACVRAGKSTNPGLLAAELDHYRDDGFDDNHGLIEAGVLLKNHSHAGLDAAMELWWNAFMQWGSRDQLSLPYVLWKTRLQHHRYSRSFRDENPYFGLYPHVAADGVSALYLYISARAHDSHFFRLALGGWHVKWRLQRWMRRLSKRDR